MRIHYLKLRNMTHALPFCVLIASKGSNLNFQLGTLVYSIYTIYCNFSFLYAPNFEKLGDILVSARPYVFMCVCVFMFETSS